MSKRLFLLSAVHGSTTAAAQEADHLISQGDEQFSRCWSQTDIYFRYNRYVMFNWFCIFLFCEYLDEFIMRVLLSMIIKMCFAWRGMQMFQPLRISVSECNPTLQSGHRQSFCSICSHCENTREMDTLQQLFTLQFIASPNQLTLELWEKRLFVAYWWATEKSNRRQRHMTGHHMRNSTESEQVDLSQFI